MADKIEIYPETLDDGGIIFEIKVKDRSLLGKKATFSIKREVSVKDSRPVHDSKDLRKITFTVSASQNFRVSAAVMKRASGSFPYSGSKISIQTFAEVKVTTAIFFNSTTRFSLSNYIPSDLPKRARVKNNAKQLIDPKDSFNFFKNLTSIPAENQIATILLLIIGGALIVFNLIIGYHDQMAPEHMTWFYSHYDSDGDNSSPIGKALTGCGAIATFIWWAMRKQLQKYMAFHFRSRIRKVNRESMVNIGKLVTGCSRVDLIDPVLRVVACNMEKGKYIRGHGSNRRTVSFSHPNRAVLLYSRRIPIIPKGAPIHNYFDEEFSFKPMFQALYPRQMVSESHGLDLVWEVQLIVNDLVDQELIGNRGGFIQKEFYSA
ncbi:MAG: hypothetical protein HN548_00310 [Opitutae bacterium]|jgi:hypothetical protein|nr:hypothetical protein [Opitutae bacterium]MBT5715927.1 hypothetical protein [Opitutae bacterium]